MDQLICMADNRRVLLKGEGFQIFRHLNDIKDLPADHPVSLFTQSLINTQKKGKKSRTKGHKLFRVSLPEKKTEKKEPPSLEIGTPKLKFPHGEFSFVAYDVKDWVWREGNWAI